MGGYSDFLKNQQDEKLIITKNHKNKIKKEIPKKIKKKLSFKFKYELEILPKEIENIQLKIFDIDNELSNNNLYLEDSERFNIAIEENTFLKNNLKKKEDRWLYLLEMKEKLI